jgi:hypothetical protein
VQVSAAPAQLLEKAAVPARIHGIYPRRSGGTALPVQELLLLVFCLVDDELKAPEFRDLRSRGPDPLLADSEVITIELVGEFLGLDRDTHLFRHFRTDHARDFPGLLCVHRTTFARQAANLWRVKQVLQARLAEQLAGPAADWLVDSMPVPVCRFGRGGYCQGFRGQAAFGYDPVQKQAYFGFRLHVRVNVAGIIVAYELAPANATDIDMLFELSPPPETAGIGDRNYWSPAAIAELAAAGVRLLAPYKTRKHDPDPARSRRLSRPRWRVETVNGQLAGRFRIKRVWARDVWHLCHRVIRKVLSHTMAAWTCKQAGLPMLCFDGLTAA